MSTPQDVYNLVVVPARDERVPFERLLEAVVPLVLVVEVPEVLDGLREVRAARQRELAVLGDLAVRTDVRTVGGFVDEVAHVDDVVDVLPRDVMERAVVAVLVALARHDRERDGVRAGGSWRQRPEAAGSTSSVPRASSISLAATGRASSRPPRTAARPPPTPALATDPRKPRRLAPSVPECVSWSLPSVLSWSAVESSAVGGCSGIVRAGSRLEQVSISIFIYLSTYHGRRFRSICSGNI